MRSPPDDRLPCPQSVHWRQVVVGLTAPLKQLEDENGRLKRIVADLTLDREMLQEVIKRKL